MLSRQDGQVEGRRGLRSMLGDVVGGIFGVVVFSVMCFRDGLQCRCMELFVLRQAEEDAEGDFASV